MTEKPPALVVPEVPYAPCSVTLSGAVLRVNTLVCWLHAFLGLFFLFTYLRKRHRKLPSIGSLAKFPQWLGLRGAKVKILHIAIVTQLDK